MLTYGYVYGEYRNYQEAEKALEDMFASGEVSEGEQPNIIRNPIKHPCAWPWLITLRAQS